MLRLRLEHLKTDIHRQQNPAPALSLEDGMKGYGCKSDKNSLVFRRRFCHTERKELLEDGKCTTLYMKNYLQKKQLPI